jgi:2-dehydropantoate 2-reductase
VGDATVRALGAGRVVVGAHPEGGGADVEALAGALRAAGYDVGVSACIGEDKWLKLCVNLMSAPNALVRREDHETAAFVEVKARCLEEARATLAAAGITARSCDGRDRSLDAEIAFQRASLASGQSARRLPIYNQVWQALRHGGPLEADRYHRRILALAARHGLAAPVNARVLEVLKAVEREKRGPESAGAEDLLPR